MTPGAMRRAAPIVAAALVGLVPAACSSGEPTPSGPAPTTVPDCFPEAADAMVIQGGTFAIPYHPETRIAMSSRVRDEPLTYRIVFADSSTSQSYEVTAGQRLTFSGKRYLVRTVCPGKVMVRLDDWSDVSTGSATGTGEPTEGATRP